MSAKSQSQLLRLHREMGKLPNNSEKMRKALSNARNIRYGIPSEVKGGDAAARRQAEESRAQLETVHPRLRGQKPDGQAK